MAFHTHIAADCCSPITFGDFVGFIARVLYDFVMKLQLMSTTLCNGTLSSAKECATDHRFYEQCQQFLFFLVMQVQESLK